MIHAALAHARFSESSPRGTQLGGTSMCANSRAGQSRELLAGAPGSAAAALKMHRDRKSSTRRHASDAPKGAARVQTFHRQTRVHHSSSLQTAGSRLPCYHEVTRKGKEFK